MKIHNFLGLLLVLSTFTIFVNGYYSGIGNCPDFSAIYNPSYSGGYWMMPSGTSPSLTTTPTLYVADDYQFFKDETSETGIYKIVSLNTPTVCLYAEQYGLVEGRDCGSGVRTHWNITEKENGKFLITSVTGLGNICITSSGGIYLSQYTNTHCSWEEICCYITGCEDS